MFNLTYNYGFAEESLLDFKNSNTENDFSLTKSNTSLNSVVINGTILNQEILTDSSQIFRWTAIEYAQNNNAEHASIFIEKYIKSTLHVGFINNDVFDSISESDEFIVLNEKYKTNFSLVNLFYLFSSLVGFFIFIMGHDP